MFVSQLLKAPPLNKTLMPHSPIIGGTGPSGLRTEQAAKAAAERVDKYIKPVTGD